MLSENSNGLENVAQHKLEAPVSPFVRNVLELLDQTEYRRCETGEDLEAIYRLRYRAYRNFGMFNEDSKQMICDDLDDLPNSYRFGIYSGGQLLSTLRLHHLTRETPWSTSMKSFGDVVQPMLDEGRSFICLSRLASEPEHLKAYPQLVYVTMRLAGMACLHFDAPYGLSTVQEHHAAFYRRVYGSECIGAPRAYPGLLTGGVVLFLTDAHSNKDAFFRRFPFFKSTTLERRMLFGARDDNQLAPLTILPTARFADAA